MITNHNINHLAAYLPYKVEVEINGMVKILCSTTISEPEFKHSFYIGIPNILGLHGRNARLRLRPLYQITETIEHYGETVSVIDIIKSLSLGYSDYITNERDEWIRVKGFNNWRNRIPTAIIETLHQYHFDTFGLIESGLAEPIPSIPQQ
jgi:hypothetical protein